MKHILLFDADAAIVETVTTQVRTMGYSMYGCSFVNDFDLLERKLRRLKPELIICDIGITRIDGVEICKYIKTHKLFCNVPVLLSHTAPLHPHELEMSGGNGFIQRPYEQDRFENTLKHYLSK